MKYCETYAALLDLFVDGELSLEEILEVQVHLDECSACRSYVDDAIAMRAAFPDVEDTEVPKGFAAGVMATIQADSTASPAVVAPKKKKTPWVGVLASLAACCAIVILQQHGPLASGGSSAPAAFDTAAEESAVACEDAASYAYTAAEEPTEAVVEEDVVVATTATVSGSSAQNDTVQARAEQMPAASKEKGTITADAAAASPVVEEPAEEAVPDLWEEGNNVVFACVVYLSADRVGSVLDGYTGKPYVTEEGIVGIGYALGQIEFERILYDEFDYPHGPELNQERTTDLCCIVVTEPAES